MLCFTDLYEADSEFLNLFRDVMDSNQISQFSNTPEGRTALSNYMGDGFRLVNNKLRNINFGGGSEGYDSILKKISQSSEDSFSPEAQNLLTPIIKKYADEYNAEHPVENFVYQNRDYVPYVVGGGLAGLGGYTAYRMWKKKKESQNRITNDL